MKVKELAALLKDYPQDLEVHFADLNFPGPFNKLTKNDFDYDSKFHGEYLLIHCPYQEYIEDYY